MTIKMDSHHNWAIKQAIARSGMLWFHCANSYTSHHQVRDIPKVSSKLTVPFMLGSAVRAACCPLLIVSCLMHSSALKVVICSSKMSDCLQTTWSYYTSNLHNHYENLRFRIYEIHTTRDVMLRKQGPIFFFQSWEKVCHSASASLLISFTNCWMGDRAHAMRLCVACLQRS
jgi:hypothetical protein